MSVPARSIPSPARPTERFRVRDELTGLIWVSPWLIGFVVFMALPMGMSLYYSFTDYPLLEPPLWVGLANYIRMATDDIFWGALKNTFVYAGLSIPLCTTLALVLAALMSNELRLKGFFRAAVFIPTLVPMVASAMIWLWLFHANSGLLNGLLSVFGIAGPNWLGDRNWAMPALIFMTLWGVGQQVVIYIAALQEVPQQLYEAADLDGMGPARKFFNVTLPMISPVVLFNVITLTIGTFQVFALPYIMTGGGPDRATYFYTQYLYDSAFTFKQMGYASALGWIQALIIFALTAFMLVLSKRLVYYRSA